MPKPCPTCCWACARAKRWPRPVYDPRHLTLLPKPPAGCPPRSSPCVVKSGLGKCIGERCETCAGFKALPREDSIL